MCVTYFLHVNRVLLVLSGEEMQVGGNIHSDCGPDEIETDEKHDENENIYFLQFGEDVGRQKN